ncbi:MAG: N-6 DNA methylase [Candidatus Poribacteria bacterium]|nr:N-6 DNA methylase [Candidatus Poribacteria bacterium]
MSQSELLFPLESQNERKTENIVRKHFEQYDSEITIEEQKSDNPRIQKLLKSASKTGTGMGKPEFIIQFENKPDFIAVVECKANTQQHESFDHDQYANYAVDGALLYASHLSSVFDVLAIGVSGMTEQSLKVSHFLHLKGDKTAEPIFSNELLPPQDYITGYINDSRKYKNDYESLLSFAKDLNSRLHTNQVSESDRSLLISAILIALERESFKNGYKSENDPSRLSQMVVNTVKAQLQDSGISRNRLNVLVDKFNFINHETILQQNEGELREIIESIDSEVNPFVKNHQHRDVLSDLYVEFLQYANSDKGLGIVLTPPHITGFFAKLAQVNKDSIVYDNCTGTGGFLIAAMKEMIEDASGNSEVEKRIKQSQIYGVESKSSIYPLAVSNMYINQDGKSNVILGNCFSSKVMSEIKTKNPDIGFLNPPYKADKVKDTEELEFVKNNLDCLQRNGTCIAIVPMRCALAIRGKNRELKREILSNHTLEAVLSMPDELFYNSNVNTVTCIMIFTAHRPHPPEKNVFLGYFKNDKFKKNKVHGRFDSENKWEEVQQEWLNCYINRTDKQGLSVNVQLDHTREWAAEKYMETDYSILSDKEFKDTLLDYSTYLFSNQLKPIVSQKPHKVSPNPISLNTEEWKLFRIPDLFTITGTTTTPIEDLEYSGSGEYPYVTTRATNNGVRGFFTTKTEDPGVLTIDSAVCGYCSYQSLPFSASDHVEKLIPKFDMDIYVAMFLVTIFNVEQYRYNYGIKCSQTRLKESEIRLPVNSNGEPDYDFMREYISHLEYSSNLE